MTGARRPSQAPASASPDAATATLSRVAPGRWRLEGVLNLTTVVPLYNQCPEPDAQGRTELDLADVQRSASAGVALLLEWRSRLGADGAQLHLARVPEAVRRLAALGNADALLGLEDPPGRDDAVSGASPSEHG